MIFCIFSYNRGRFLENCVRSIETCVEKASIYVFDDTSDDPDTLDVLEHIHNKHAVFTSGAIAGGKHGGLYGNMQTALLQFAGNSMVCFLQDDTQLVRRVEQDEIQALRAYFDKHPQAAFLHPCFLKGATRERDRASLRYDSSAGVYRRVQTGQSAGTYYSDVCILSPGRLMEKGWTFSSSEPANDRRAGSHFEAMGHLFAPFAMWLPETPAWRGKHKTLALRLAERRRPIGFHPFHIMTDTETTRLKSRSPEVLPFAEDFLQCSGVGLPQPWSYYPLQGSRWLKKLNSWELFLRRL